jgi:2-keto-4-pentenoate hydratase/2-oxohepta-3-ene-1,7-dioic acid hydratase in catechol pathway
VWLVSFERPASADASIGAARLGFETLDGVAQGVRRLGAMLTSCSRAGSVVDLNRALAVKLAAADVGAPEAEADSLLPADAKAFLRRGPGAQELAAGVLAWVEDALERYDAPDLRAAGVVMPRRSVRLASPVPRPGKLIAVESNYPAPGLERPPRPSLFLEASSALAGPEDDLELAPGARVRFQAGLAAVIGQTARDLRPEHALDCVAGYCAAIDFAHDDAGSGTPDPLAHSGDRTTPIGPALVTRDEIPDPQDLGIRVRRSRDLLQIARTKEMLFPLAELLAAASRRFTLEPGDLLLSGGLPNASESASTALRDGDVVEVEIERLGKLSCYVRAAGSGV